MTVGSVIWNQMRNIASMITIRRDTVAIKVILIVEEPSGAAGKEETK